MLHQVLDTKTLPSEDLRMASSDDRGQPILEYGAVQWLTLHDQTESRKYSKWVRVIHFEGCRIGRTARDVGPGPGDYISLWPAERFLASSPRRRRDRFVVVPGHSGILWTFRAASGSRGWHRHLGAKDAYPLKQAASGRVRYCGLLDGLP